MVGSVSANMIYCELSIGMITHKSLHAWIYRFSRDLYPTVVCFLSHSIVLFILYRSSNIRRIQSNILRWHTAVNPNWHLVPGIPGLVCVLAQVKGNGTLTLAQIFTLTSSGAIKTVSARPETVNKCYFAVSSCIHMSINIRYWAHYGPDEQKQWTWTDQPKPPHSGRYCGGIFYYIL